MPRLKVPQAAAPEGVEVIHGTEDTPEKYGYGRVSTVDQSLDMQVEALRGAGVPASNIFVEKVSSAKYRPVLKECLEEMRPGDVLHVWKLDRLARSVSDLEKTLADLQERGIGFRSLTEQIDTTTAMGKLVFHVLAAFAEFERNITRERTRAGLKTLKDQGIRLGRAPKVTPAIKKAIQKDLDNLSLSIPQIAAKHGLAPSTINHYFSGYRTRVLAARRHK